MNTRLATTDSALDLSVLSDASPPYSLPPPPAPHPTIVSQLAPDVLALPASVITLPGSDKVPFHISASGMQPLSSSARHVYLGHLVLANFTTERVNGSLVFKQSPLTLDQRARASGGDQSSLCVEGHNLSELVAFAERLRHFRRKMALSQSQLCQQLSSCFPDQLRFSQSFICRYGFGKLGSGPLHIYIVLLAVEVPSVHPCRSAPLLSRFEKMHVTLRTALNSQPYLRRWLERAELQAGSALYVASNRKAVGKSRCSADARLGPSPSTPFAAVDGSSCTSFAEASLLDLRDHQNRGLGVSHSMSAADCEVRPVDPQQQPTPNSNIGELEDVSSLPVRRRRKTRTFFSIDAVRRLNAYFDRNPIPRGAELTKLASELGYERESVRTWFCNRRQLETSPSKRPKKQTALLSASSR
ncbi:unnamed protein product [Schistocephalus solidus]|uniref:Homeobox domain-containing protein n=1 Tax=Schistocephalus solidus TaxID=70667 RepID=A0A183TN21_SCHSO|nr:unnamed protein product [Schistocephalus solidus]